MGPFFVGVFATRIFGEQHLDMAVLLLIAMTTPVCIFLLLLARNYREELVRQGTFSASDDAATR